MTEVSFKPAGRTMSFATATMIEYENMDMIEDWNLTKLRCRQIPMMNILQHLSKNFAFYE